MPELPPYRPPSEAASVLLRVTRGCAWNRCTFCGMYKGTRFEVRPLEELRVDLEQLRAADPEPESVFLADSDALVHPRIRDVLELVRAAFPNAPRVTTYSRLQTLQRKPAADLAAWRSAGLTRIHAGLESGDPKILAETSKGTTPEMAREASRKVIAAGLSLSLYLICGLGGERRWKTHAAASGRLIGEIAPDFLRLRSLVPLPGTPLHERWRVGEFHPITPASRLRETDLLVRSVRAVGPAREIEVCSDHFSNYVWADGELVYGGINGCLPSEGDPLTAVVQRALERVTRSRRVDDPATLALRGRGASLYVTRL
jgi:biotin synthase-like enzyme